MLCKQCGAQQREDTVYCINCGALLEEEQPLLNTVRPSENEECWLPEPPAKKRKMLLPVLLAVLLLAGAALSLFLLSKPYEALAEDFVEAIYYNDLETLQELLQPEVYEAVSSKLDIGVSADRCTAQTAQAEKLSEEDLADYNELLSILGAQTELAAAYRVTVHYSIDYYSQHSEADATVIVGRSGLSWRVITLA